MKIVEIKQITPLLLQQLLEIWESSVKATHLFLSDNEIDIKKAIKDKDKEMLIKQIMQSLNIKHNEHNITTGEQNHDFKRTMSKIGG